MATTRLAVRSPATIRNGFLRTVRYGFMQRGVANPNVSPNSEFYVLGDAFANEQAVAEANAVIKADASMPDTAQGDDLIEGAAMYGVFLRDAVGSQGPIVMNCSAPSPIPAGTQLIDDQGRAYEVTTPGTYANEKLVTVRALVTGDGTNLAEGTTLRWVVAPPFADAKALVGPGGLRFGADKETLEELRSRWLEVFQAPPSAGNWSHVNTKAEGAYAGVQKSFTYPAIYGPGTMHVAVTARPTSTNKNRDLDTGLVTSAVEPAIDAAYVDQGDTTVTTVANVPTDLAIGMVLPSSPAASPPGPGGGWLDGSPWPVPHATGAHTGRCDVTALVGAYTVSIPASAPPSPGVSRVAWCNAATGWKVETAVVLSYVVSSGTAPTAIYDVTFDRPVPNVAIGAFMWPAMANQDAYKDKYLEAFALLGPGEKSANPTVLVRGTRKPVATLSWSSQIDGAFTNRIQSAGSEVLRATIYYASQLAPSVPGGTEDPPNILVPRHMAFYPSS